MKKHVFKAGRFLQKHILLYNLFVLMPALFFAWITRNNTPFLSFLLFLVVFLIDLPWLFSYIHRLWNYIKIGYFWTSKTLNCILTILILLPGAFCLGTCLLGLIIPFALISHLNATWGLYYAVYMIISILLSLLYIAYSHEKYEIACTNYYIENGEYPKGYIPPHNSIYSSALLWFIIGSHIGHSDSD